MGHGIEAKIAANAADAQGISGTARSLGVPKQKVPGTLKKRRGS